MEMEAENYIDFHITEDQAKTIAAYFYKEYDKLEDYEICELLDKLIDNLISKNPEVEYYGRKN